MIECFTIPAILLCFGLLFLLIAKILDQWGWLFGAGILGYVFLIAIIACPIEWYGSYTNCLTANAYHQNILVPNKAAETDTHIIVTGIEGGIWQAGELNLSVYNMYLVKTRYWDSLPIVGSIYYTPPEHLKLAQVVAK